MHRETDNPAKNVTFILTEECNFRCTYCYLVDKKAHRRMPLEIAKAAVDYLLTHRDLFPEPAVSWDFIGGEPLLEVETIERTIDYAQLRAYELGHPWFDASTYSFTTNGALYGSPKVQRLISRYRERMGVTISIDGPAHVHDLVRRSKDGQGTYALVVKNIPLWLDQFPTAQTKMTFNHDNLPFVAESILHVMGLGIRTIVANVVFEDVWHPGDDAIFEWQLDQLGDSLVERGLWRTHDCTMFQRGIGVPLDRRNEGNWCGSGKMLAIDWEGNFYPCNRFVQFSLDKRQARTVGSVADGMNVNRLRPFIALTRSAQSTDECVECPVARGCAWCQGYNYDEADTPTIYQRATHICEMHKARVRANRRFWAKVDDLVSMEASQ